MKAELIDIMGDDLAVVNAARVSYGKQKNEFDDKDERLIRYLLEHGHTSPFRHVILQYRIECPIYVERQLFKHQVGMSANSISGRYVDFSDSYHQIEQFRYQSDSSKQGSAGNLETSKNEEALMWQQTAIDVCRRAYDNLVRLGVAKEQARTVLPLCLNTTFIWTGSLQAFINLFSQRLKPDAQQETRELVQLMLNRLEQSGKLTVSLTQLRTHYGF